jgi:hypothetical protein
MLFKQKLILSRSNITITARLFTSFYLTRYIAIHNAQPLLLTQWLLIRTLPHAVALFCCARARSLNLPPEVPRYGGYHALWLMQSRVETCISSNCNVEVTDHIDIIPVLLV